MSPETYATAIKTLESVRKTVGNTPEIDAAIAELEADERATQRASEWTPLPDGDYTYQVQRGQHYLVRVEDEGAVLEAGFTNEFFETNVIKLDSGHRLCRLGGAAGPDQVRSEADDKYIVLMTPERIAALRYAVDWLGDSPASWQSEASWKCLVALLATLGQEGA